MIHFASQLSLMLEVGTSLTDALEAIAGQTVNPRFQQIVRELVTDVREGRQLSEAMSRFPHVFDGPFVSVVRAGEAGGFLKDTLDRVVLMQEKQEALANQLRAALAYPGSSVPRTYLIGPDGKIEWHAHIGALTDDAVDAQLARVAFFDSKNVPRKARVAAQAAAKLNFDKAVPEAQALIENKYASEEEKELARTILKEVKRYFEFEWEANVCECEN